MTDQPTSPAPVLDVQRPPRVINIPQTIAAMKAEGYSPFLSFPAWLKLRCGPNRLPPGEYLGMKLWDKKLYPDAKLNSFIGKAQKARDV